MLQIIFSVFILLFGIRLILHSYIKPDRLSSTKMKGYLGGTLFIILGIISLWGKFSLYETIAKAVKKTLRLKGENGGVSFALFVAVVCLILFFTYYRPDKLMKKYKIIKTDLKEKVNVLSDYLLFYFWFLFVLLYIITKLFK